MTAGAGAVRWGAGAALMLAAATVGTLVGPAGIGAADVARTLLAHLPLLDAGTPADPLADGIVWDLRLPRVVLAAAGGAYQGGFRNPLADPYLLGIAAGAGFGATLALAYGPPDSGASLLLPLAAFAGGSVSVGLAWGLGRSAGPAGGSVALILAGITVASF